MRRCIGVCVPMIILCLSLTACSPERGTQAEQMALDIRAEYLAMEGCSAVVDLTADYGQRVYEFQVEATYRQEGESVFIVTAPEEIAGVTARLREGKGYLEYDGVQVETGPITDDSLSPIEAIPLLLYNVGEGFMAECGMEPVGEQELLRVVCRDPLAQAGQGVECSLWFDPETHALLRGELSQDGFTAVTCVFSSFQSFAREAEK